MIDSSGTGDKNIGFQILGDAYLRQDLVIFSKRNQSIGIVR